MEERGHPPLAAPLQTNNSTTEGILDRKVSHKRATVMYVIFYWVKDMIERDQYFSTSTTTTHRHSKIIKLSTSMYSSESSFIHHKNAAQQKTDYSVC
jgi:hypothetical protein